MGFKEKSIAVASKDYVNERTDMDLVYENTSQTSSYSAQELPLDLSKYRKVHLTQYVPDNAGIPVNPTILVGEKGGFVYNNGGSVIRMRSISVTASGISFGAGRDILGNSERNQSCIPHRIYGIK